MDENLLNRINEILLSLDMNSTIDSIHEKVMDEIEFEYNGDLDHE